MAAIYQQLFVSLSFAIANVAGRAPDDLFRLDQLPAGDQHDWFAGR
jgi:hypothetical protein